MYIVKKNGGITLKDFKFDYYRFSGNYNISLFKIIRNWQLLFMYLYRKDLNIKFKLIRKLLENYRTKIGRKRGVEIPISAKIGKGFLMIHPYLITINRDAIIGENCTMMKGSTIGSQKRGSKKGAPILGNDVYVGLNSTIVGNIRIGDNVLIAPNTFVNFDVPSNSVVIGSPGTIHHSENATKEYHNNAIEE